MGRTQTLSRLHHQRYHSKNGVSCDCGVGCRKHKSGQESDGGTHNGDQCKGDLEAVGEVLLVEVLLVQVEEEEEEEEVLLVVVVVLRLLG